MAAGGSDKPGVVQVFLPKVPVVLPGQYFLFLVSEQGKPSVGVHFHVGLAARGKGRGAPKSPGNKGKATTPLQPGSAAAMGGGGSRAGSGVGNGDGSPSMVRDSTWSGSSTLLYAVGVVGVVGIAAYASWRRARLSKGAAVIGVDADEAVRDVVRKLQP